VDLGCNPADIPEPAIPASLIASDICDAAPTLDIVAVQQQTNGCLVTRTVTIRASDACSNRATTNLVTIWSEADTMIPPDVCLADRSAPCAAADAPETAADLDEFRSRLTSLCVRSSGVQTTMVPGCGSGMIFTHVYTAELDCGGIISCTQEISTTDTLAPVVTAPAELDLGCNPATIPEPAAADFTTEVVGCSPVTSSTITTSVITNGGARALLVVLTRLNECGLAGSATQMIVWTVSGEGLGILPIPVTDLGCNPSVIPEPDTSVVMPAGLQVSVGAIRQSTNRCTVIREVEYLVTDACNNAGSVTQTLTWSEAGAAAFVDLSGAMDEMAICVAGRIPELSATDGCGTTSPVPAPTIEILPGGTDCTRSERRIWSFMGACGSTITHTQTITITAEAPRFSNVPADRAIGCRDALPDVLPAVSASACGNELEVDFSATGTDSLCGELVRTWTATGPCGTVITASQEITVVEDIAPVLSIPTDADLGCNPDVFPVADAALASATDNCSLDAITAEGRTFTNGSSRVFEAVYTATDACGNQSIRTQTVTYAVGNCEPPPDAVASVVSSCAEGVVVSILNPKPGSIYTTSLNDQSLDGTRVTFTTPPNGNQTVNVIENPGGIVLAVTPSTITVDCAPPTATAAIDCDTGLITVTITGGETDNGFQLTLTNPNNDMAAQSGDLAAGATISLTFPISADGTYALAGFEDNNGAVLQIVPNTFSIDCPEPVEAEATAMFSCAEGLVVTVMSPLPGSSYVTTFNGLTAVGTRVTFPDAPPNGDQTVRVVENPGVRVVNVTPSTITVDCAPPTATAAFDCGTGLITVTIKGGETENGFQLAVTNPNGDIAAESGTILAGATTNVTFPITGDGTYNLNGFEDNNGAVLQIVPDTLTIVCPKPPEATATATSSCAEGVVVTLLNPLPGATYTSTVNGQSADGTRASFPTPPNGVQAVNVIENPGGRVVTVTPNSLRVDCAPPTATAAFDCDTGLITVTVTGGEIDNGFQLAVTDSDNTIATQSGSLAAGATTTLTFPISNDGNYRLRGSEDNNGTVLDIVPNAFFIDCPKPPTGGIRLEKTVYSNHDNGLGCPGQDRIRVRPGRDITYCFTVLNSGPTPLTQIMVVDQDLTPMFMGEVRDLAPGERATLFYETTMGANLLNTATVSALVADNTGDPVPGSTVTDEDTAEVDRLRFDLALFQSLITRGPFAVGRDLRFRIRVLNEGEIPARNIELVNNIPPGLRLADSNWTLIGPNRARYNFLLPRGIARGTGDDLLPGEDVEITINFVVEEEASGLPITNVVEIAAATDETGAVIADIDSIAGGGASSEDDIAPVEVEILPPSVILGERVWIDRNFNGVQDPDEPGVSNVVVQAVAASNGMVFGTATSDVNGVFAFVGLPMGNFALDYDLRSLPDGFIPTTYLDGRSLNTGLLMPGESDLDLGLAVWQPASASGIVWFDLNGDGTTDFDNAANLGIANVAVRLFRIKGDGSRTLIDMVPSAARGGFEFPALLPGTYEVEADTPSEPPDLVPSTMNTQRFTVGFGLRVDDLNFGFTPRPTAIGLETFHADLTEQGVTITWKTAWEENTLGFYLYRIDAAGQATRVNEALVLARGGDTYQLTDPGVPGGRYWLEEIDDDLNATVQEAEAIARVSASPLGTPTETLRTSTDEVTIGATSARSYLVAGFTRAPQVIDQTNPDFPLQLVGEHLQTDAGHATYFSPAAGRKILIRGQ